MRLTLAPARRSLGRWLAALALALAAVSLPLGEARAERIKLKNQAEFEGWIVEEDDVHLVLAVIRNGAVGTLRFDLTDIESVSRERKESLEQALIRERERMEQEESARLEAERLERERAEAAGAEAGGAPQAAGAPGAGGDGGAAASSGGDASAATATSTDPYAPIVLTLTDAERKEVEARLFQLGQAMGQGQGSRRAAAISALIAFGPKALPQLGEALGDGGNSMRRMNIAKAITGIAAKDNRIGLYLTIAPKLVERLDDTIGYVRQHSNEALEQIAGQRFGTYDTQRGENPWFETSPTEKEREITAQWQAWWKEQQAKIDAAKAAAGEGGEAGGDGSGAATSPGSP